MERVVFKWMVATWLVVAIAQTTALSILGLWVVARLILRLSI